MNTPSKIVLPYEKPTAEVVKVKPLYLLETVSIQGNIEDFEDGENY